MNVILFDDKQLRTQLLPFTFTRPVADIRVGIVTIREKWEALMKLRTSTLTEDYLSIKFPLIMEADNLWINASALPNSALVTAVSGLKLNEGLFQGNRLIAARQQQLDEANLSRVDFGGELTLIADTWDIFKHNAAQIKSDFTWLTQGRKSIGIQDSHTIVYKPENIFVEEGAIIKAAVLNAENGPIYIGKNAEVQEGSLIRGPFALCESSVVNMGAKMRGDTTIGPFSKVGGEISNSVVFGYSNKGHDGFMGNSVIGEWCNLGADTNTSNLKNNYANVKLWSYAKGGFKDTGLQFCGLMMGDHAKCGINTMFNTGTVVGVNANVFGDGFPRNFVPSYAWGGAAGFTTYKVATAFDVAEKVMARRGKILDQIEKDILSKVFELTAHERTF